MKRVLTSVFLFLVSLPAFAGGRGYDNGGCTAEQTNAFCSFMGLLLVGLVLFVIVFSIWDNYKMRTDPAYRARAEQWRREYDEKQRRGY